MKTTQSRRLAAILFADIVGYTAMMQSDEGQAMSRLERYQEVLTDSVAEFKGEIVKNYGDGSLCLFSSVLDAVKCSVTVQEKLREEPKVPLRIGLHLGDVMFRQDDIYGNAINIASRIESMGVPGAVLLSREIYQKVKNQPDFEFQSLGEFEFKNVEESISVYGIANDGFVVPDPGSIEGKFKSPDKSSSKIVKWLIPSLIGIVLLLLAFGTDTFSKLSGNSETISSALKDKRVAVMVFENKTGSEDLKDFGTMISDWVTRGLMETGDANVISAANVQDNVLMAGAPGSMAKFSTETGVGVVLQGRYYLQEADVIIHANVVDTERGEVIHALDPIQGPRNEIGNLLEELTQKILGYWSVRDINRFTKNPPKYEAYQKYLAANKDWGSHEDADNIERLLWEAYRLDSSFHASLLKLAVFYGNSGQRSFERRDSVLQMIEQFNPDFTSWEELRHKAIIASKDRNYLESARLNEQMFLVDRSDVNACYNSAFQYKRSGMPKKAIEMFDAMDSRFRAMSSDFSWFDAVAAGAHYMLEDFEEVVKVATDYSFPKMLSPIANLHMRSLVRMDKPDQLDIVLVDYVSRGLYTMGGNERDERQLYRTICEEAYINDKAGLLETWIDKYQDWITENVDSTTNGYLNHMEKSYFLAGNVDKALLVMSRVKQDSNRIVRRIIEHTGRKGAYLAMLGDTTQALKMIEQLNKLDYTGSNEYDTVDNMADFYYAKARIQANLSQKEAAVDNLKLAQKNGMTYDGGRGKRDVLLKPLLGFPPYEALMKPRG